MLIDVWLLRHEPQHIFRGAVKRLPQICDMKSVISHMISIIIFKGQEASLLRSRISHNERSVNDMLVRLVDVHAFTV